MKFISITRNNWYVVNTYLAFLVELDADVVKRPQDFLDIGILGNSALRVKRDQVGRGERLGQLEPLEQALFDGCLHVLFLHADHEPHLLLGIVIVVVLDPDGSLFTFNDLDEFILEVLRPHADGQLGDLDFRIADLLRHTRKLESVRRNLFDGSLEIAEPGRHGLRLFTVHHPL